MKLYMYCYNFTLNFTFFKQHISFCSAEYPLYTSYQKGDYTDLNPCINLRTCKSCHGNSYAD